MGLCTGNFLKNLFLGLIRCLVWISLGWHMWRIWISWEFICSTICGTSKSWTFFVINDLDQTLDSTKTTRNPLSGWAGSLWQTLWIDVYSSGHCVFFFARQSKQIAAHDLQRYPSKKKQHGKMVKRHHWKWDVSLSGVYFLQESCFQTQQKMGRSVAVFWEMPRSF